MARQKSFCGMRIPWRPRIASRIGASTSNEIVVRLWARMRGSIGGNAWPEPNRRPVKAARPRVAEIPQHNAADAMNRYPRNGCLLGEELFESVGIKSDHHFFADHQGWCRAALVGVDKILDGLRILANITFFEHNPFLRKVAFGPCARWSARLGE